MKDDQWPAVTDLPPLAPLGASDDERARSIVARLIARKGAPPSVEDYRRPYAACGLEWPGEDEIRRRHPVSDTGR
jgi:hypothetical protein